jgi:hypothetical protein
MSGGDAHFRSVGVARLGQGQARSDGGRCHKGARNRIARRVEMTHEMLSALPTAGLSARPDRNHAARAATEAVAASGAAYGGERLQGDPRGPVIPPAATIRCDRARLGSYSDVFEGNWWPHRVRRRNDDRRAARTRLAAGVARARLLTWIASCRALVSCQPDHASARSRGHAQFRTG